MSVVPSFAASTAKKLGKNERTVRRYVELGAHLDGEAARLLVEAGVDATFTELRAVAALPAPKQVAIARRIDTAPNMSVRKALAMEECASVVATPAAESVQAVEAEPISVIVQRINGLQNVMKRVRDVLSCLLAQADATTGVVNRRSLKAALDDCDAADRKLQRVLVAKRCDCGSQPDCGGCDGSGWRPGRGTA